MLLIVAGTRPYDALSLLDEPLWRVLWTFHQVMERRAREQLMERLGRVDAGNLTAMAFNKPELLDDEMRAVQQAIRAQEEGPVESDSVQPAGLSLLERVQRGRVLAPEALVS